MARSKRQIEKPRQIWLTPTEAAGYAGVRPETIWRWGQNGLVMVERSPRKKGAFVYRKSDIDKLIGCGDL